MKKNGFSILEVMVALGLLGIATFFVTKLMRTSMSTQRSVEAVDDARSQMRDISNLFANQTACKNTFVGQNPVVGFAKNEVRDVNNTPAYEVGKKYGNRTIELVGIKVGGSGDDKLANSMLYVPTGTQSGVALVVFNWKKTGEVAGPSDIRRFLKISVNLDASNHIENCSLYASDLIWQRSATDPDKIFYGDSGSDVSAGIGTYSPASALDVRGEVRVGASSMACSATNSGAVRYEGGHLKFCNGSAWAAVLPAPGSGVSGIECTAVYESGPPKKTGIFAKCPTGYSVTGCTGGCRGNTRDFDLGADLATNSCRNSDGACDGAHPLINVMAICCRIKTSP